MQTVGICIDPMKLGIAGLLGSGSSAVETLGLSARLPGVIPYRNQILHLLLFAFLVGNLL